MHERKKNFLKFCCFFCHTISSPKKCISFRGKCIRIKRYKMTQFILIAVYLCPFLDYVSIFLPFNRSTQNRRKKITTITSINSFCRQYAIIPKNDIVCKSRSSELPISVRSVIFIYDMVNVIIH